MCAICYLDMVLNIVQYHKILYLLLYLFHVIHHKMPKKLEENRSNYYYVDHINYLNNIEYGYC